MENFKRYAYPVTSSIPCHCCILKLLSFMKAKKYPRHLKGTGGKFVQPLLIARLAQPVLSECPYRPCTSYPNTPATSFACS